MHKMNGDVEQIELNGQKFLANYETGALILLDTKRDKIMLDGELQSGATAN